MKHRHPKRYTVVVVRCDCNKKNGRKPSILERLTIANIVANIVSGIVNLYFKIFK
ncbi:hypothetical protein HMPREF0525_01505 [Lactobacillus jensenii 27-2-CHN]|nr:hypothetical protein HMPREF0525_01505 [Lactobacillus jensenii 27-2-CHN]